MAGTPERTGAVLRYERQRVEALARRPVVDRVRLPPECAGGVLIARTTDAVDPLGAVRGPARFSWVTQSVMRLARPVGQSWFPLVVVVHHFVVTGAELLELRPAPRDHPRALAATSWPGRSQLWTLVTQEPGDWYHRHFEGRMHYFGPGNPYLLWACPLTKPPDAIC